ncbi:Uncharacterised protein [Vibrio furnissii]|nr:Uncharacterised protein [Vibrio furnissii]
MCAFFFICDTLVFASLSVMRCRCEIVSSFTPSTVESSCVAIGHGDDTFQRPAQQDRNAVDAVLFTVRDNRQR